MEKIYASIQEKTSREIVINEVDEGRPCLMCKRCPGFVLHEWRHTCQKCKCPRQVHDVYNYNNSVDILDRLGWLPPGGGAPNSIQPVGKDGLVGGYIWVPPGLSPENIADYMQQLPKDKVPKAGTPGERYRDLQLIRQLPRQDMSDKYCHSLHDPQAIKEFRIFRELRDQVAMDIGKVVKAPVNTTCSHCQGAIRQHKDLVITASKFSSSVATAAGSEGNQQYQGPPYWHPACFACCTCRELLVDLVYCHHQKRLLCQRHYAQSIRPRCSGCDEVSVISDFQNFPRRYHSVRNIPYTLHHTC
ncbi:hypothetical protein ACOMHN_001839 [Nucella lapillus]